MQPWLSNLYQTPHNRRDAKKKFPHTPFPGNRRLLPILAVATVAATIILLLFFFHRTLIRSKTFCRSQKPSFVPLTKNEAIVAAEFGATASPLVTILHYATARAVPQQSAREIRKPFDVLQYLAPCNFLVFGVGHDSLMWDSFNPRGVTLFIEENPRWTLSAIKRFPILRIHTVRYSTRLSQADALLSSYKKYCPEDHALKGNRRCPLALSELPEEVYERDWDVIMIDAPRGYYDEAPGRMGAIYSAAVMARGRKRPGVTHVFLHDTDRKVEQQYAQEFLCMKYRVGGVRRLWHFVIPPAVYVNETSRDFC